MFSQLKLEIESDTRIDFRKSSALQGVIFENVDTDFAEMMHQQNLHPYSQYVLCDDDKTFWVINTLNEEAYEKIIKRFLSDDFQNFNVKNNDIDVDIVSKTERIITKADLVNEMNNEKRDRYVNISILTPMTFRQRGSFICYPDIRLIFQSIMNKYSSISDNTLMIDAGNLEQMVFNSIVTKYNVRSTVMPVENVNIPGAIGNMRIKFNGSDLMARYVRLLFRFSEFSGIGAKTGMGMGAVKVDIRGQVPLTR